MDFFGIDVAEPNGRSSKADMLRLLKALCPQPSPAPLIRIGPAVDGGYLVPDDLDGITACFSPGVSNRKRFEDDLVESFGIAAHLCDASSDVEKLKTPLRAGMQTFEKLWLDITGADDAVSLADWVARHRPDPGEDLLLQIDIEGAEYRNLLNAKTETLRRFRIIVLEVHGLQALTQNTILSQVLLPFFEGLAQEFTCVHFHPNNAADAVPVTELGVSVPPILELTYLRNDRFDQRARIGPQLPHPKDISFNMRFRPPLFADDFFRGRPPSAQEIFRMSEDMAAWRHRDLKRMIADQTKVIDKGRPIKGKPGRGRPKPDGSAKRG